MGNEFTLELGETRGSAQLLRVSGRLDARSAQELLDTCRKAREGGCQRVLANLSGVTFVASSGVGTLLALTEEFRESGGGIHLIAPSEPVSSVVGLLNLAQFLNISGTEAEVLQAIGA